MGKLNVGGIKAAGEVVHIRVSPEDIMAAIDIIDKSGMATVSMSLAMVVKWAMSFAFEAARHSGSIPRRDGFEYSEMVGRFLGQGGAARLSAKNKVSRELIIDEIMMQAHDKHTPDIGLHDSPLDVVDEEMLGYIIPADVRIQVDASQQDIGNISSRMFNKDENITDIERAKWMLYSVERKNWELFMSRGQMLKAEKMITGLWPEYPALGKV